MLEKKLGEKGVQTDFCFGSLENKQTKQKSNKYFTRLSKLFELSSSHLLLQSVLQSVFLSRQMGNFGTQHIMLAAIMH